MSFAENGGTDPNAGGAEGDGGFVIARHAHGELFDAAFLRKFGEKREVRPGIFVRRGNAHQSLDGKPKLVAAEFYESRSIIGGDTRLLRFQAGVHLHIEFQDLALFPHLLGEHPRNLLTVDRLDDVEKRHGFGCLVGLQRADQMQLDIRSLCLQPGPFALALLHSIFTEDTLARRYCQANGVRVECLGDGDKLHGSARAGGMPLCRRNS